MKHEITVFHKCLFHKCCFATELVRDKMNTCTIMPEYYICIHVILVILKGEFSCVDGSRFILPQNYYFHRSVLITILLLSCDVETTDRNRKMER